MQVWVALLMPRGVSVSAAQDVWVVGSRRLEKSLPCMWCGYLWLFRALTIYVRIFYLFSAGQCCPILIVIISVVYCQIPKLGLAVTII